jgi:hypothetical protein
MIVPSTNVHKVQINKQNPTLKVWEVEIFSFFVFCMASGVDHLGVGSRCCVGKSKRISKVPR